MKKRMSGTQRALLLVCALVLAVCCGGIYGAALQRQRHVSQLRESCERVKALSDALSVLHSGRAEYLAELASIRNGENDYEIKKDLVGIAGAAVEKRRVALQKAEAAGTLSGSGLDEARSELQQLDADFAAQKKAVTDFESLKAKVAVYEKQKTQARAILEKLREDERIREKIDAGATGPVAAAAQALAAEAAAVRRRFYAALCLFAALGASAVIALRRALSAPR